ncbi:MAG: aminopeptidase P family protein [Hyphomonadaceae bacterium]|nr:aminopeptidase P family protein [Hyphomonadaceae bacterium]
MQIIQNFEVQGGPDHGRRNLPKLRAALADITLDGFLIPHEDAYNNEYLPDCNERLMWATGFTGSAGAAVVLAEKAAVFVDGRYAAQVRAQVDPELFACQRLEDKGLTRWLRANVKQGDTIGYDACLHSPDALEALRAAVEDAGGTLEPVGTNPVDTAWEDRPPAPVTPVVVQPVKYAGETHTSKRNRIARTLREKGAQAALITAPASIAWLLNIRGGDVKCSPLPLSTAILRDDGHVDLFVNPDKISDDVRRHLGEPVTLHAEAAIETAFAGLSGRKVMVDPGVTPVFYFDRLEQAGADILRAQDPVALPKACKNETEIKGTTQAHKRDGAVMVRFLHWLDAEAQAGTYDEIDAALKLEGFRRDTGVLKDLSFETISGAGPNGALPHYRVSRATVRKLERGTLYLVDSGGQYLDGTTDITRTVPIGTPTQEMRARFTLVLKGHIALAVVRFPKGTTGSGLDVLARHALWQAGFDFDHGTGHGVGVFLGVHEGPQRISKTPDKTALKPGMIVSNEPGYYKDGAYGIRIENLQYVTEARDIPGGERPMSGFRNITLAPIHHDLIVREMLTESEIDWVNAYHTEVLEIIGPRVEGKTRNWLEKACRPV